MADKTLGGEADRLKEYIVALDALGKPSTYDPRHDSVVRLQVGRLRVKLGEYYQSEGAADPIVVSLPKGGFKLNFEEATLPVVPSPDAGHHHWLIAGLVAAVVLLSAWGIYAALRIEHLDRISQVEQAAWSPELEELWAPFLQTKRPLMVCIGAPLFLQYPNLVFLRDPGVNVWDQLATSPRFAVIHKAIPDRTPVPWYSYTGVGEAGGAFQLAKLLGTRRGDLLMTRSNLLSWQEISDTDMIFVGPPKFNTQLQSIPIEQEVKLETDGVRILHPRAGEPSFFRDTFMSGPEFNGVTHAVISCTPGLSGQGELLIIGGNASPDTLAAAQWMTQPERARELVSHLRLSSGTLPRYYQVVIRVEFKNGTPVESSYVLHRVLQNTDQTTRPAKQQ
ncbi:MAG TPA: hypothetical protein VG675_09385 [Bryobacteraceae bacterium]|nr:hypothetical protein [Bryobacteraceae bacterium]